MSFYDVLDSNIADELLLYNDNNKYLDILKGIEEGNLITAAVLTALIIEIDKDITNSIKQSVSGSGVRVGDVKLKDIDYFGYNPDDIVKANIQRYNKEVGLADKDEYKALKFKLIRNISHVVNTATKIEVEKFRDKLDYGDDLIGFLSVAVLDDRTTDLCRSLHNVFYAITDRSKVPNKPPRHINCRSQLIPIYKYMDYKDKDTSFSGFVTRNISK